MRTQSNNIPRVLPIPIRLLVAALCMLLGVVFFPMIILGGVIAWSVFEDIKDAPQERAREAELEAAMRAPVEVDHLRMYCDSPAETAFLDAMVKAYGLTTGPGAVEGSGLRLRNQVPMGDLRIYKSSVSYQYYADFLIDENLVVEIDGAAYHSSPDAVARDRQRDADMREAGYKVLRIPAITVFQNPAEAMRLVEKARSSSQS